MSGSTYGQHVHSLYVPHSRPVIPRQRSNSLPPGLAMMNAEEANMLFSAAEKATARRKKTKSIHYTTFPDSPPDSDGDSPIETAINTPFKPSSLRQTTSIRASMNKPLPPAPAVKTPAEISYNVDTNTDRKKQGPTGITLPESLLQTLPVSPLSPKRHVASQSLKSYADGLFKFTHTVLATTIPILHVESPAASPQKLISRERDSIFSPPLRPLLESKFSDWSVATGAYPESRRDSLALTPIQLLPTLLSPDSFFGVEETPRRQDLDFNRFSGISYASSETYEPLSSLPALTPPSRTPSREDREEAEISYFTNFDQYLDAGNWPLQAESAPEKMEIKLSPLELASVSPIHAPQVRPARTYTAIKLQARSAPLLSSNAPPCFTRSQPHTPYQRADVAFMVSNPVIRAVG